MVAFQLAEKKTIQNSKAKMHGLLECWSYTFKAAMGLKGLKRTTQALNKITGTLKGLESGVIQTSGGLTWPSNLAIRSEMVFRKEGVSTIKRSRKNGRRSNLINLSF